jgi:hypothetical protein
VIDHRDRVDRLAVAEIPGLSEPDPLQPAPEGQSLRRVGATADVLRGYARRSGRCVDRLISKGLPLVRSGSKTKVKAPIASRSLLGV